MLLFISVHETLMNLIILLKNHISVASMVCCVCLFIVKDSHQYRHIVRWARQDGAGVWRQGVGSYYYVPIYMLYFNRESCVFANI